MAALAVVSIAVVVIVLLMQEGAADAATWGVLSAAAVLGCSCVAGAVVAANAEARGASRRYAALQRLAAGGQADVQEMLHRMARGERIEQPPFARPGPLEAGPLDRLAHEIALLRSHATAALIQVAQPAVPTSEGEGRERAEVFANLARRLQSLVHRAIGEIDDLEHEVEDPELLKRLFQVDHLLTRNRRYAENLAVLGGAVSRRQWSNPVSLMEVLRSSIAEVEQYSRVKLVPEIEGTLHGHAVADVIHLLAELVENATVFSKPHTNVLLSSQRVAAGLAVEVEDRGLGMPPEDQGRINALLANPNDVDVSKLLADGRIGIFVVAELARRHGIAVQLRRNIYGGVQAVVVIPHRLLGDEDEPVAPRPATVDMPRHTTAVPTQRSAVQAAPAAQPLAAPPAVAQPLPEVRRVTMSPHVPQHQPRTAEAAPPRDYGSAHHVDAQDGRPELPRRNAQQHLVPQLMDTPGTRTPGGEDDVEPSMRNWTAFTGGFNRAEGADESPSDGSR
ncbi:sensor histidine kinase [Streptomyces himalayensis]|uniref:histidine kinase n=1 Tax=Streptomyces himalayensis subsp. himalayensis TaxID=2756131 RepID=A0A7W0DR74_9ACTN|nr:ATP-binding protein [Streptomyces himalayensis]MBA2949762.1 sensor histidine kinase [Streptomyces himalayensis subsp. himalayensis]